MIMTWKRSIRNIIIFLYIYIYINYLIFSCLSNFELYMEVYKEKISQTKERSDGEEKNSPWNLLEETGVVVWLTPSTHLPKTYLFYFNFIINSNPHTTQLNPCPHHTPKFNITQLISTKPLSKSKCDFQVFEINFNFISIYRLYHWTYLRIMLVRLNSILFFKFQITTYHKIA